VHVHPDVLGPQRSEDHPAITDSRIEPQADEDEVPGGVCIARIEGTSTA
jgi:hypothetical protein